MWRRFTERIGSGPSRRFKFIAAGIVVLAVGGVYLVLWRTGISETLLDGAALRDMIERLGVWGPVAVIALLVMAILVSPIPSAPIAVATGAAYGHLWGTVYVLLGAEIGAIAAFMVARLLGYDVIHKWFGDRLKTGLLGSQNALMGFVLVSRLLPFISFDIVSYAAGLTVLSFWRFALATLAGIVPASFLLAHFGGEISAGDGRQILISVVLLGAITLLPFAFAMVRHKFRRHQNPRRRSTSDETIEAFKGDAPAHPVTDVVSEETAIHRRTRQPDQSAR